MTFLRPEESTGALREIARVTTENIPSLESRERFLEGMTL
jgi:hypothetical protein